jgi:pyrroline-5-carboxylate reductase
MGFAGAPLLLVGGGKMGEALLAGWLKQGLDPTAAHVVEPDAGRREHLRHRHGVAPVAEAEALPEGLEPRVLVIALKPQVMGEALAGYRSRLMPGTLIVSIAAGRGIGFLQEQFGAAQPIVRVMPNTPAAVGRGVSVLCAGPAADATSCQLAESLMRAVGETFWVADEDLMHAVTAVSGSGPAYVFLLAEELANAGVAAGLPPALADSLARATVSGAGELLHLASAPADQLRRDVTSPRGTTEAALAILMADDGLSALLRRAVAAAAERSRALA